MLRKLRKSQILEYPRGFRFGLCETNWGCKTLPCAASCPGAPPGTQHDSQKSGSGSYFGIFSGPEVQKLRSGSYCSYFFRVIWTSLMAATAAIIISNSIIFYYNIPLLLHCTHVVYCMTLPYMISSCLLYYITYCITCTIGVGTLLAQLRQDYTVNRDSRNCEHVCVTYYAQTPVHERLCIIM